MYRWIVAVMVAGAALSGCASPKRPCPECEPCHCASATEAASPPPSATPRPSAVVARPSAPVPLDLPKSSDGRNPIARIRVDPAGNVFLDEATAPADDAAILAWARARITENPELRVSISADRSTPHGAVMNAIDILKQAGVNRIAFASVPRPPLEP